MKKGGALKTMAVMALLFRIIVPHGYSDVLNDHANTLHEKAQKEEQERLAGTSCRAGPARMYQHDIF